MPGKRKRHTSELDSRHELYRWLMFVASIHQQRQIIHEGKLDVDGHYFGRVDRSLKRFSSRHWHKWLMTVHVNHQPNPSYTQTERALMILDTEFFELVLRVKNHTGSVARQQRAMVRQNQTDQLEQYLVLSNRLRSMVLSSHQRLRLGIYFLPVRTTHVVQAQDHYSLHVGNFAPASTVPDQYIWCTSENTTPLERANLHARHHATWNAITGVAQDFSLPNQISVKLLESLTYPRAQLTSFSDLLFAVDTVHPPIFAVSHDQIIVSREDAENPTLLPPVELPADNGTTFSRRSSVSIQVSSSSSSSHCDIPAGSKLTLTSRHRRYQSQHLDTFCTSLIEMRDRHVTVPREPSDLEYRHVIVRLLWQETEQYDALLTLADVVYDMCGLFAPLWHLVCDYAFPSPADFSHCYRFPRARSVTPTIEQLLPLFW